MTGRLMKTEEFAAIVQLSPDKVRQRIRRGEINASNLGTDKRRIYRISEAELERYLKATAA